ncbi:unnamed protein product [Parascedosporium putredinis]|uniref:tRNA (guanine(10)-N(2))-methyltransferase n=1 Tax=Parascedosporium putredinis TaxID=1442378 RepID=A0A9P1GWH1_9PEZI|nr:unnamed protein product [Parascedosporium putredinis]CAI7989531.1 unnamed protein product [Parascedosporium putredinis]
MDFIVRFTQSHETFRIPEIEALAIVEGVDLKVKEYRPESPYCIVTLPSEDAAKRLVQRSILVQAIYEHWADATTLADLQDQIRAGQKHLLPRYQTCSFKFNFDSFQGTRQQDAKVAIINSFAFLAFKGPIALRNPDEEFAVLEEWSLGSTALGVADPARLYFGRVVGAGARDLATVYTLKKRGYISTTSMDSELALVTANVALAGPGKLFYDPFVGTGSFPVACSHFGALSFGSDIDGRAIRGQGKQKSVKGNFDQYGIKYLLGGMFVADLTNTPVRISPDRRIFDGIVCDPPYGVREGLKVLGCRDPEKMPWSIEAGKERSHLPDYIPPKKPYSFVAMLDDILAFSAATIVDNGRLAFWMPTANDEAEEIKVPTHPCLEVVAVSTQEFNKWILDQTGSRKLIAYRRIPDAEVSRDSLEAYMNRQKLKVEVKVNV